MAALRGTPARVAIVVVLLLAVVLAQNAAVTLLPSGSSAKTGRLIGRAGFAYLSGIRTFAAAVLWNRLEPQYHKYYADRGIAEDVQLLPTLRLVQSLDPQFVQVYYNVAWIIAKRGDRPGAIRLAREGIERNPRSGLLKASYIQLMLYEDKVKYLDEIVANADAATAAGTFWANDAEEFEGYAVLRVAYEVAGLGEKEAAARGVMEQLRPSASSEGIGGDHDHDGDGKPDH